MRGNPKASSLRGAKRRSDPSFLFAALWIASRSLSSGAHSRDPLARNDGVGRPAAIDVEANRAGASVAFVANICPDDTGMRLPMDARAPRTSPDAAATPRRGADHIAPDCAGQNFYAIDRGLRDLLAHYLPPDDFRAVGAAFRSPRRARRRPARRAGADRRQPSAGAAPARPLRPRRGLDRLPPRLPRDGADRLRRLPVPRHEPPRRRARHGSPAAAGRQIRAAIPVRAGRVRPDVPDQRHRHLDPPDPQIRQHRASGLSAAEDAVGRPRHDVEGHAVHDREGRRLRRRQHRNDGAPRGRRRGGCTATSGSARTPTPTSRCCWRGPKARPPAPGASRCSRCRAGSKDGSRNSYRIVRLKDKLGTRSMASGEILLEGAVAYLVGQADQGLKQMMEQVNLSRLSHGVRAAAMMRRCVNEAMVCARIASRVRQHHHRLSAAAPPADEDHRAGRAGAVDVHVRGRCAWTTPMPARRTLRTACAS